MKPYFTYYCKARHFFYALFFLLASTYCKAQSTETFNTGSFIINMGATNPGTIANSIKPYGLIYDLIRNYSVPVKLIISPAKTKDGVDFTYNAVQYKGGTFIIKSEYRSAAVNSRITYWISQGVVGTTTTSSLTLGVTRTLQSFPRWTLDAQNGKIAEGFLLNAGINNTAFPTAYNWNMPAQLGGCNDFFVMPHADPTWAVHGRLWSWNKDQLGAIWAGCHAVSVLENMFNPSIPAQKTNFLSTTGLVLFSAHGKASPPYTYQYPTDPIAQFMGKADLAMQNGSEQVFLPKLGGAWNPGVKIIGFDPTQADVPVKSPGQAVVIVYGRGMDDPSRGFVMYEAAHNINNNSSNSPAAQRAFFNFSFCNTVEKNPLLTVTGITEGMTVPTGATVLGLNVVATSLVVGATFTYQWTSACGGSFSNPTGATTNFTAPSVAVNTTCTITCKVTDNCGRSTFQTYIIIILANHSPTVVNDAQYLDPGCGGVSLTYNVLANDYDQDGQPLTLTNVTGVTNGTMSFTSSGNITYSPNPGFVGVETLTYTVCDNTSPAPLCSTGTYTITVGNVANVPNSANDAFTIAEDIPGRFNVLANDVPVVSGPLTVSAITANPANGRVSINTDNTITYIPNPDYSGTDNFTYRVVNSLGYSKTATVTVTVTGNTCSGSTYLSAPGTNANYSQQPVGDSYIEAGGNATKNYGTCNQLIINREAGKQDRFLLKWDLSSIPTGSTINSATITLTLDANAPGSSSDVSVHQLTNDWVNGTGGCSGINNRTVNWTNRIGTNPTFTAWGTAGGDFNATAESTQTLTNAMSAGQQVNWSVNNLVQGWVNTIFSNYGAIFKVVSEVGGNNMYQFASVDNATVARRPVLTINYTTPPTCSPIPTRAPIAMPDTTTTPNGVAINFATATNDYFPVAGAKTYSLLSLPASGTASINALTGVISYTPATTYNGVRFMTYRVLDNTSGLADTAFAYVNITNGPIVANDDYPAGALSGVIQTINVKANDTDPENPVLGNSYTVTIITPPKSGTATVDVNGNIVYTPNTGFTGNDTLYYSLTEPAPACGTPFSDPAMVVIVVVNRTPTPVDDTKDGPPCQAVTLNLLANDTDPEGNILTVTNISALNPPAAGTLTNNNDGTVTFMPAVGFSGTVTFTYTVTDNGIPPLTSAPATVTINIINPVNTPPVAVNDVETINMDQVLYASVLDNDYDPDENQLTQPVITVAPLHGTATVNPVNGLIQYTPNPGFFGTDVLTYQICDILTVNVATCAPGPGACATATLTINIEIPNATFAVNDENSTWINTAVSGVTVINDFDLEADAQVFAGFLNNLGNPFTSGSITVSGIDFNGSPVANAGTISILASGGYTYTPANSFTGIMTVLYIIRDNNANPALDTGLLVITVSPLQTISNSVIANNDEKISYGTIVSDNVLVNDRDPQANAFTVTGFKYDTNGDGQEDQNGTVGTPVSIGGLTTTGKGVTNAGSLVINSTGTYSFTPTPDFHGMVKISYTICDNILPVPACSVAELQIEVLTNGNGAANDLPFGGDDFGYTSTNVPINGNFASNDYEPNGNPMSLAGVTINTGGPHTLIQTVPSLKGGTVAFYTDGTYTYNPPFNYIGPDLVTYSLCDVTAVAPQPLCTGVSLHLLVTLGTILPIDLLTFTGKKAGKDNFLQWSTAQEINSDHFELENWTDNTAVSKIATITAKGYSSIQSNYSYIHRSPAGIVNYYRLKMVDKDNRSVYSNVVAIKTDGTAAGLNTVYPNPFRDRIDLVVTTEKAQKLSIRIIDINGRNLREVEVNAIKGLNQFSIKNLDNMASATYFIIVQGEYTLLRAKIFKTNK